MNITNTATRTERGEEMTKKQITLRLPDEVYGALRDEAEKIGLNITAMILLAIAVDFGFLSSIHRQQSESNET